MINKRPLGTLKVPLGIIMSSKFFDGFVMLKSIIIFSKLGYEITPIKLTCASYLNPVKRNPGNLVKYDLAMALYL